MNKINSDTVFIFLDFDGVLHNAHPLENNPENQNFYYLSNFENTIRKYENVRIVIASSWRCSFTLEQLRSVFSEDIAELIIDKTPDLNSFEDGSRLKEVKAWLQFNGYDKHKWIGIDDIEQLYSVEEDSEENPILIKCMDKFDEREMQLFDEAMNDIQYSKKYKVPKIYKY